MGISKEKRKSPVAKTLSDPKYQQKIVESKKRYSRNRKVKKTLEE